MPVAAGISAVGSLGGAALGYFGSKSASDAQVQQQQAALAQQNKMFQVLQGAVQPLIDTGKGVLSSGQGIVDTGLGYSRSAADTLKGLLTPGGNMSDTLSKIPGFTFAQDWGQKAVQNIGTTMGLGGNTLKAGADYATGAAQQGYGGIVSSLLGLLGGGNSYAGVGANLVGTGGNIMGSGVNALAGGATSFSGQASNTLGNIGNAEASGILGSTNALSGGIAGAANSASNALMLSKLLKGGSLGAGGVGLGSNAGIYSAATGGLY